MLSGTNIYVSSRMFKRQAKLTTRIFLSVLMNIRKCKYPTMFSAYFLKNFLITKIPIITILIGVCEETDVCSASDVLECKRITSSRY